MACVTLRQRLGESCSGHMTFSPDSYVGQRLQGRCTLEVKDQTHLPCLALWQRCCCRLLKSKNTKCIRNQLQYNEGPHTCLHIFNHMFHYTDAPTRPIVPLKSALVENNEVTHLNIYTLSYALYTLLFRVSIHKENTSTLTALIYISNLSGLSRQTFSHPHPPHLVLLSYKVTVQMQWNI